MIYASSLKCLKCSILQASASFCIETTKTEQSEFIWLRERTEGCWSLVSTSCENTEIQIPSETVLWMFLSLLRQHHQEILSEETPPAPGLDISQTVGQLLPFYQEDCIWCPATIFHRFDQLPQNKFQSLMFWLHSTEVFAIRTKFKLQDSVTRYRNRIDFLFITTQCKSP